MDMLRTKSQSAIEFLSVYGTVLVVVALVIALLFLFINAPTATIQNQCGFYSGFGCINYNYTPTGGTGPGGTLRLQVRNMQTGTVNISAFNAYLHGTQSVSGSCTPTAIAQGQISNCTASFAFTPNIGAVYNGGAQLVGNYCPPNPGNTMISSCPASSGLSYTASIVIQATK